MNVGTAVPRGRYGDSGIGANGGLGLNGLEGENERDCSGQMCRGHDSRITTLVWTDSETNEHFYQIRGTICSQGQGCGEAYADSVYEYVNQNDVPFTSNDLGNGQRNLLPYLPRFLDGNQPIRHIENADLRTSVNVTLRGHKFYPGTVTHRVHFEVGFLSYDVVGVGAGGNPSFNNSVGMGLFTSGVRSVVNRFGR